MADPTPPLSSIAHAYKKELNSTKTRPVRTSIPVVPPDLWHYTDAEGLKGIIEKRELWFSHVAHLNDTSEDLLAHKMIEAKIEARVRTRTGVERQALELLAEKSKEARVLGRYVTCFCEDGDLLSQWRSYGADGGGYSVGFESGALEILAQTQDTTFFLPVIYDRSLQESWIENIIDSLLATLVAFEAANTIRPEDQDILINMCATRMTIVLLVSQLGFKDPAFAEEKEWRIVRLCDQDKTKLEFRARRNRLIPFLKVDMQVPTLAGSKSLPVSLVHVGPTHGQGPAVAAVELLLAQNQLGMVNVEPSQVPYRA
jgi:hypothetical protein